MNSSLSRPHNSVLTPPRDVARVGLEPEARGSRRSVTPVSTEVPPTAP